MRQTFLYETNGDVDKLHNTIEEAGGKIIEVQSHYDTGKRIVFDAPDLVDGATLLKDKKPLTLEVISAEIDELKATAADHEKRLKKDVGGHIR